MKKFLVNDRAEGKKSVRELQAKGYTVVCAPREIPGEEAWYQAEGCMGHGRYYAAAIDPSRFLKVWEDYEAKEIQFITDEAIIQLLKEHCIEKFLNGEQRFNELYLKKGDRFYLEIARVLGLPYWGTEL